MFARFRRARPEDDISNALYGAIVTQSRSPALYTDLEVPDTVEGRFEMVIAHMAMVLRRVWQGDDAARAIGQATFDVFCKEMDDALRGLGVKDTSVGKRMRNVTEAYYGRATAYDTALAAGDDETLAETLRRTVYEGAATVAALRLANYMSDASQRLGETPVEEVLAARIRWPVPGNASDQETSS